MDLSKIGHIFACDRVERAPTVAHTGENWLSVDISHCVAVKIVF